MASTYSSYKIELIGTGEQSGTWGNTTNNNFQYAIEQAIGGYATQVLTTTSTSLTLSDTNALQNARALFLQFTGTPGSGATVVLPSIQKLYFIKNAITTYDLIVKTATAATITIPNGKTACIYVNGTDVVGTNDWLPSLTTTSITATTTVSIAGNTTIGGNFSTGTSVGTSGTYGRSLTTVTVTSAAHGFSNGQILYLSFSAGTGGTATSGVYTISGVTTDTFQVTDSVSGTITGSPAVSITKYNNTITLNAPVSAFGSYGTIGQVLVSQGSGVAPQWVSISSVPGDWTVSGNLTVTGTSTFNGNTTVGSTAVTSGTYSRTTTTVTVTSNAHGFSNGQILYLVFSAGTGGTATSGIYAISNVATNTFDVTDTASGTITGSPAVSITKYNNTATLLAPLSSFGSVGASGYLLASQGAGAPPQWVNGVSSLTNSTAKLSVDSSGNFTSVVPSGSTLLPTFFPRAWANFDGTTAANINGNYTNTTTTVTATINNHGLIPGNVIYADVTPSTGNATDGVYTILTTPDANTFTYTNNVTTAGSGSIILTRRLIRGSGNITSISRNNATGDYTINFGVPMPDTNYSVTGSASNTSGAQASSVMVALASASSYLLKTTTAVRIYVTDQDVVGFNDGFDVNVIVIR